MKDKQAILIHIPFDTTIYHLAKMVANAVAIGSSEDKERVAQFVREFDKFVSINSGEKTENNHAAGVVLISRERPTAIKWNGENKVNISYFTEVSLGDMHTTSGGVLEFNLPGYGQIELSVGEWIVKTSNGFFFPMGNNPFHESYEITS